MTLTRPGAVIHAHDFVGRLLAISQGCSYTRENLLFLRRHECTPIYSHVWNCTPVRVSSSNVIENIKRSRLDGFIFHTQFRASISCLCVSINIRNATGIISSLICVTLSQSSTLSFSGFFLQARRYSLLAIAFHTDLWLVRLSLGVIVLSSMTKIKSRLFSSTSMHHFHLR